MGSNKMNSQLSTGAGQGPLLAGYINNKTYNLLNWANFKEVYHQWWLMPRRFQGGVPVALCNEVAQMVTFLVTERRASHHTQTVAKNEGRQKS